jgi:hypothetical protein
LKDQKYSKMQLETYSPEEKEWQKTLMRKSNSTFKLRNEPLMFSRKHHAAP